MAWRKPTIRDLTAKLSQAEVNAFRKYPDFATAADPARDILELTASFVRGFCRRNEQVVLSPEEYTIPESLMSPAMDYAAFDVLKRLALAPGEARVKAYEEAISLFKSIASGEYIPESWYEDGEERNESSNRALPSIHAAPRRKILDWHR